MSPLSHQVVHVRYEGRIVQEIIRADGGKGDFREATPSVMGIWDTLLKVRLTMMLFAVHSWILHGNHVKLLCLTSEN